MDKKTEIEEGVIDQKNKRRLLEYYESKIARKEEQLKNINIQLDFLKSNFELWKAYLEPKLNITTVYPEPRKDKNGVKPKPYYRAITSIPIKGRKKQILVYVGTIEEFEAGIDNKKLHEKATQLVQRNILKNFPTAIYLKDLEKGMDSVYEEKLAEVPLSKREKFREKHTEKMREISDRKREERKNNN